MKQKTKLTHKLWTKILAVILMIVTEAVFLVCAAVAIFCYNENVYSTYLSYRPEFYGSSTCYGISSGIYWDIENVWLEEGVEGLTGQLFDGGYLDEEYTNAVIKVYDAESGELIAANTEDETVSVSEASSQRFFRNGEITVSIAVEDPLTADDIYAYRKQNFDLALYWRYPVLVIGVCSALLFLTCLIFMFCAVGHREGHEGIALTPVDKVPLDLLAVIGVVGAALFRELWVDLFGYGWGEDVLFLAGLEVVVGWFLLSFATRCKAGGVFKNTIIFRLWKMAARIIRAIGKFLRDLYRALPLLWKALLILCVIAFLEVILIAFTVSEGDGFSALLFVAFNLVLLAAAAFGVWQLIMLKKAGKELASGNFDYKVNSGKMYWEFRQHGEHLNSIGLGMAIAVDQRTRSERLKTELITNVSHDIKTPLTSIINYVDLLQRPELSEEERAEYLEVLARQSRRLKKLTEDLVEASKASTGNMSVTLVPTNVKELLDQAVAEYAERLQAGRLEPIIHMSEEDLTVMADGRLLWRVMDNLLNNVCKYALSGTRVYLDARKNGDNVVISVKNVSRDPLNVSEEELMERFVRGDTARSTEGSGLGLNIARSLTELQHGTFDLTIDGDLFKAEVTLKQ